MVLSTNLSLGEKLTRPYNYIQQIRVQKIVKKLHDYDVYIKTALMADGVMPWEQLQIMYIHDALDITSHLYM